MAGGKGSRLGGCDKAALEKDGETLVVRTVSAIQHHFPGPGVVVGPTAHAVLGSRHAVEKTRFGGPAVAVKAGLDALSDLDGSTPVLVTACDWAHPHTVAQSLAAPGGGQPVMLVSGGRTQFLAFVAPLNQLAAAFAGATDNDSLKKHLAAINFKMIDVDPTVTDDIDTPADVERHAITRGRTDLQRHKQQRAQS
nr:NTP transferase domain-containing protein [Corynebacterium mendelii]